MSTEEEPEGTAEKIIELADSLMLTLISGASERELKFYSVLSSLSMFVGSALCCFAIEGQEEGAIGDFTGSLSYFHQDPEVAKYARDRYSRLFTVEHSNDNLN